VVSRVRPAPGHLPAHLRLRPPPATSVERSFRGRQLPNRCSLLTLLASLVPSLQGRSSPVPSLAVVSDLLGRDVAVVATVQRHRHPFTDALKRRPDVRVLRVTEQSRDALPKQLAAQLHAVGVRGRAR
jgi:NTPase